MFGVGAYDKDNNELDTLDGVTLNWFVGAHRDIAKFHGTQTGRVIILYEIFQYSQALSTTDISRWYHKIKSLSIFIQICVITLVFHHWNPSFDWSDETNQHATGRKGCGNCVDWVHIWSSIIVYKNTRDYQLRNRLTYKNEGSWVLIRYFSTN